MGRTSQLDMEDRCGNWGKEGTVGSVGPMARFGQENKVNTLLDITILIVGLVPVAPCQRAKSYLL